jgi:hypothetical protein
MGVALVAQLRGTCEPTDSLTLMPLAAFQGGARKIKYYLELFLLRVPFTPPDAMNCAGRTHGFAYRGFALSGTHRIQFAAERHRRPDRKRKPIRQDQ